MKKKAAFVLCLSLIFSLCGCSLNGIPEGESPETLFNQAPAADESYKGSVYYLNINYEADEAWQEIARTYTELSGIPVKVVSPERGNYDEVFEKEMNCLHSPTMFHCGSRRAVKWGDYCLDLSSSPVFQELAFPEFVIKNDYGAVSFISYRMKSYGLIVNKALLADADYTPEEISDFEGLCDAVNLIHEQSPYLGYDAFAPLPLGDSLNDVVSELANIPLFYEFKDKSLRKTPSYIDGAYLESFRALWDLYTGFSATAPEELADISSQQAEDEFTGGRAVFYLADTGCYDRLISAGMDPGDLAMLPIHCGIYGEEKAAFCTGPTDFWAVNNESEPMDIQATLDFMNWLVTSEEGLDMMMYNFGVLPFNSSIHGGNSFETKASNLILEGNFPIQPAVSLAPGGDEWVSALSEALELYTGGSGSWDDAAAAFTQNWNELYEAKEAESK